MSSYLYIVSVTIQIFRIYAITKFVNTAKKHFSGIAIDIIVEGFTDGLHRIYYEFEYLTSMNSCPSVEYADSCNCKFYKMLFLKGD